MKIAPFKLEEFWTKYEFTAPHILCASDVEGWKQSDIVALADAEMAALWRSLKLGYTEVPGHPLLRQEVAGLYSSLKAEDVVTVAGGEEGIYVALKTLLSPGDHAVIVTPNYQSLLTVSRDCGADITEVPLRQQNQWQLKPHEVEAALRPNTRLIIITNPHNPTGADLDLATLESLVAIARKQGCYIFSDEMYRFAHFQDTAIGPSVADIYERGIALSGMTKPFGLAGLRIGWLASRDSDFMQRATSRKLYTSICNSAPSEILAIIALRAKEVILGKNNALLRENMKVLDAFFQRQSKRVSWVRPQAGTVAVLELLLPMPVDTFAEELVADTGVLIMPASVFDLSGRYFRIGFGRKNLPEVLDRFENYLVSKDNHCP